jgi:GNAT superfamily N-acetyltransferase
VERVAIPDAPSYLAEPFELDDDFEVGWWHGRHFSAERDTYLRVLLDGSEVGRVLMDSQVELDHYGDAPLALASLLEIELIEIAASRRGEGLGRQVVELLCQLYPDRQLVALSEDADGFWSALGWIRHDHPDGPDRYRPAFFQQPAHPVRHPVSEQSGHISDQGYRGPDEQR